MNTWSRDDEHQPSAERTPITDREAEIIRGITRWPFDPICRVGDGRPHAITLRVTDGIPAVLRVTHGTAPTEAVRAFPGSVGPLFVTPEGRLLSSQYDLLAIARWLIECHGYDAAPGRSES